MKLELWSSDDTLAEPPIAVSDITDNGFTRFDLSAPVTLKANATYNTKVTNMSDEVVGVYAKASSNSDAGTTGTSQILVVGQHNANPEHVQPDFALSGCIEALI